MDETKLLVQMQDEELGKKPISTPTSYTTLEYIPVKNMTVSLFVLCISGLSTTEHKIL